MVEVLVQSVEVVVQPVRSGDGEVAGARGGFAVWREACAVESVVVVEVSVWSMRSGNGGVAGA